jgi:flagellar biosynthesis/type III secretory pathway chaperone
LFSDSHSEVLNELKKIRNELSTLTSKQQELMNNIMKEISTAKQEILTKLEVEDKRQKKGSVPVVYVIFERFHPIWNSLRVLLF